MNRLLHVAKSLKSHIPGVIIAMITLFYLLNLQGGHNWGGDFSMYVMNAQNLLRGAPYAQTNYIYNVDVPDNGPQAYPPVFPLMLAPVIAVFGVNYAAMKLVGILCFVALLFYLNRHMLPVDTPPVYRVLYLVLVGLFPPFFGIADTVMSEITFTLFTVIALKRINDSMLQDASKTTWRGTLLTAAVIYLSYGTRALGIFLLPTVFLLDLFRNQRIRRSTWVILVIASAFILLQSVLIPETGNYLDQFPRMPRAIFDLLLNSLLYYFMEFASIFAFKNWIVQDIVFLPVLEFVIVGVIARLKEKITAIGLFSLLYLGGLLFWPAYQGMRFLLPIIPFYMLYLVIGLRQVADLIKAPAWLPKALPAAALLLLAVYYPAAYQPLLPRPVEDLEKPAAQELFAAVRSQTTLDDRIAFFNPRVLALYTNRKSIILNIPGSDEQTLNQVNELGVDYLIVYLFSTINQQKETIQLIHEHPDNFQLVYENSDFRMYRCMFPTDATASSGSTP